MSLETTVTVPSSNEVSETHTAKRQSAEGSAAHPDAKRHEGTALTALKTFTTVVADSGDYGQIEKYKPEDATTNPSLLLQVVKNPEYESVVRQCVASVQAEGKEQSQVVNEVCEQLLCAFGKSILAVVPGRVSLEVDAELSFDTEGSVAMARKLVKMFEEQGIKKDRLLIKLAATWEGCQAAKQLEAEGINCNMTLIFSLAQAIAAAEAGAFLISPFVGRILDWYKKATGESYADATQDPGVLSVRGIYSYYKKHNIKTIVMGASFRNVDEVLELAGCDRLTIAPSLLKELEGMAAAKVTQKLHPVETAAACGVEQPEPMDEKRFRWELNEDQMATEKLSEGIRKFHADWNTLKDLIKSKL